MLNNRPILRWNPNWKVEGEGDEWVSERWDGGGERKIYDEVGPLSEEKETFAGISLPPLLSKSVAAWVASRIANALISNRLTRQHHWNTLQREIPQPLARQAWDRRLADSMHPSSTPLRAVVFPDFISGLSPIARMSHTRQWEPDFFTGGLSSSYHVPVSLYLQPSSPPAPFENAPRLLIRRGTRLFRSLPPYWRPFQYPPPVDGLQG